MISIGSMPLVRLQGSPAKTLFYNDFEERIVANGGTISNSSLVIIDSFVNGCKADGTWDIISQGIVMPFVGNNLAAAVTPLCAPYGAIVTSYGFVNGDYSEAAGLTGNPILAKYIDTGVAATKFPGNFSQGFYSRSESSAVGGKDCGAIDNTLPPGQSRIYMSALDIFNGRALAYGYSSSGQIAITVTDSLGFYLAIRQSDTDLRLLKKGVQIGSNTTPGGLPCTGNNFIFGYNLSGDPNPLRNPSGRTCGFYMFTPGMTLAQGVSVSTRVQDMQTSLGRNV